MNIFPKISNGNLSEEMNNIIRKSQGIEIQYFDETEPTEYFNFENEVIKRKEEFSNLKEIIIHPPLNNYNIEFLLLKDKNMVLNIFKRLVNLSEKLKIHICFVFHTYFNLTQFKSTKAEETMKILLKELEGTEVTILFENMFMVLSDRRKCSAIEIVKSINHPNLRACIDTTHMHCKASIWKIDFNEMIKQDLNKEDCNKYVRQIHFAAQLNDDGYIEKSTHGRVHPNEESLKEEINWLREMNMFDDKNIITEVSEEDYVSRKDQIKEIHMIENNI